jgi:hypothetical protein
MPKIIRLPNDTKLESQMLNYILKVMDEKGEVVEAWQYEGYSGHAMWDVESDYKRLFPKESGYTIDW